MSEAFLTKTHFRHLRLHEFHQAINNTVAVDNLRNAYGYEDMNVSYCQQWLTKFQNNDFIVEE